MKYIKLFVIAILFVLATGGIEHGQNHLYDGVVPHTHSNGIVHSH